MYYITDWDDLLLPFNKVLYIEYKSWYHILKALEVTETWAIEVIKAWKNAMLQRARSLAHPLLWWWPGLREVEISINMMCSIWLCYFQVESVPKESEFRSMQLAFLAHGHIPAEGAWKCICHWILPACNDTRIVKQHRLVRCNSACVQVRQSFEICFSACMQQR